MFIFPECVCFCCLKFSLVAANKVFHCGVSRGPADTVSVLGVPVPGPDPADPQQPGQGQTLSGSNRTPALPQQTGFRLLRSRKKPRKGSRLQTRNRASNGLFPVQESESVLIR